MNADYPQRIVDESVVTPVDDHFPLSVAQATMASEGPTKRSAPTGAGTPHGRGLARRTEGTTGLMHTVDATPDNPPPPACPLCTKPAASSSVRLESPGISIGDYRCPTGHIWTTRWLVAS